jgi:hypothetical protein
MSRRPRFEPSPDVDDSDWLIPLNAAAARYSEQIDEEHEEGREYEGKDEKSDEAEYAIASQISDHQAASDIKQDEKSHERLPIKRPAVLWRLRKRSQTRPSIRP